MKLAIHYTHLSHPPESLYLTPASSICSRRSESDSRFAWRLQPNPKLNLMTELMQLLSLFWNNTANGEKIVRSDSRRKNNKANSFIYYSFLDEELRPRLSLRAREN